MGIRVRWMAILIGSAVCLATVCPLDVQANGQVTLVALNETVQAEPGAFVTLAFRLRNDSGAEVGVALSATLPPAFSALGGLPRIDLAAGARETLFLTVVVGGDAPAGISPVALTAKFAGGTARAQVAVDVERVAGLVLHPPPDGTAEPGEAFALAFSVTNDGNGPDQVTLAVEAPAALEASASAATLTLLAGESRSVAVTLTVPADTTLERVRVTLTASSNRFPTVSARAAVTLGVLPPLPQAVGGRLVLEVPTVFGLAPTVRPARDAPLILTASVAGDADFGEGDRIDYRLAFDNLSVRDLRFELKRGHVETRLGRLLVSWTDLLAQAGDGAQLTLSALPRDGLVSVAALVDGRFPRVGAQLGADIAGLRVRLSQLARFEPQKRAWLGSLGFEQPVGEGARLRSEWALSQAEPGSRAWGTVLRADWENDDVRLDAEWLHTGTGFAGERADQRGFRIAQSLDREDVALRLSFGRFRDKVTDPPDTVSLVTATWRSSLRWSLPEPGPTWVARLDFDGTHARPDLSQSSRLLASLQFQQSVGPANLSATVDHLSTVGTAGGRDELTLSGEAAIDLKPALVLLRAGQSLAVTPLSITPAPGGTELLAALQLAGALGHGALSVLLRGDAVTVDAVLDLRADPLAASASVELDLGADGDLSVEAQASLSLAFDAPIAFIPINGRIQGVVFEDGNRNGTRDPDEPGVPDLVFRVGQERVRTDAKGRFRSPPLAPASYEVRLTQLPLALVAGAVPDTVEVRAGKATALDLPINRVASVRGIVFDDADQDGTQGAAEAGVPNVGLTLTGPDGEVPTRTDGRGRFGFSGLAPGDYRLALDAATLPPRAELTTPAEASFTLAPGEAVEVAFGAFRRPQTVRFVPTAAFSVTPASPLVGQTASFNASASFDPDGDIVRYAWDLDGDGQVDAEGVEVATRYGGPGVVRVTLIVTDNQGNTDSLSKDVTVVSP